MSKLMNGKRLILSFFFVYLAHSLPVLSMHSVDYEASHGPLQIRLSSQLIQLVRNTSWKKLALDLKKYHYGEAEFVDSECIREVIDVPSQEENPLSHCEAEDYKHLVYMGRFNAFQLTITHKGTKIPWHFKEGHIIEPYFEDKISLRTS